MSSPISKSEYQTYLTNDPSNVLSIPNCVPSDLFTACADSNFLQKNRTEVLNMLEACVLSEKDFPKSEYQALWTAIFKGNPTTTKEEEKILQIFEKACTSTKNCEGIIPQDAKSIPNRLRAQLLCTASTKELSSLVLRLANPEQGGEELLIESCMRGDAAAALALVESGCSPLKKNSLGQNALQYSLRFCPCDQLPQLIEAFANQIEAASSDAPPPSKVKTLRDLTRILPKADTTLDKVDLKRVDENLLLQLLDLGIHEQLGWRNGWAAKAAGSCQSQKALGKLMEGANGELKISILQQFGIPQSSEKMRSMVSLLDTIPHQLWEKVVELGDHELLEEVLEDDKYDLKNASHEAQGKTWNHVFKLTPKCIQVLVKHGANPNWAGHKTQYSVLSRLLVNRDTAQETRYRLAKTVYELGGRPSLIGNHTASYVEFYETFDDLSELRLTDQEKITVWTYAVTVEKVDFIRRLVKEARFDINQVISNDNRNALFLKKPPSGETLRCLIELGIDVHCRDTKGYTALDYLINNPKAAELGLDLAKALVDAEIPTEKKTTKQSSKAFPLLLHKMIEDADSTLACKIMSYAGQFALRAQTLSVCLEKGYAEAVGLGFKKPLQLANTHKLGQNLLIPAINSKILAFLWKSIEDKPGCANTLIAQETLVLGRPEGNVPPCGYPMPQTWLQMALLSKANLQVIKSLVHAGAAPTQTGSTRGYTPFQLAIRLSNQDAFSFFIENVEMSHLLATSCDGQNALHLAVQFLPSAIQPLLEKGLDINGGNGEGRSPLQLACRLGSLDAVIDLLKRDASVFSQQDPTPLDLALTKLASIYDENEADQDLEKIERQNKIIHLLRNELAKSESEILNSIKADPFFQRRIGEEAAALESDPTLNCCQFQISLTPEHDFSLSYYDCKKSLVSQRVNGTPAQIKSKVIAILQKEVIGPMLEDEFNDESSAEFREAHWTCRRREFEDKKGSLIYRQKVFVQLSTNSLDVILHYLDPESYEPRSHEIKGCYTLSGLREEVQNQINELSLAGENEKGLHTKDYSSSPFLNGFAVIQKGISPDDFLKENPQTQYAFLSDYDQETEGGQVIVFHPHGLTQEVYVWGSPADIERQVKAAMVRQIAIEVANEARIDEIQFLEPHRDLPKKFPPTGIALQPDLEAYCIRQLSYDLSNGEPCIVTIDVRSLERPVPELVTSCKQLQNAQTTTYKANLEAGDKNRSFVRQGRNPSFWKVSNPNFGKGYYIYNPTCCPGRFAAAEQFIQRSLDLGRLYKFCKEKKVQSVRPLPPAIFLSPVKEQNRRVLRPSGTYANHLTDIARLMTPDNCIISFSQNINETHAYVAHPLGLVRVVVPGVSEKAIEQALADAEEARKIYLAHPMTAHGMQLTGCLPELTLEEPPENVDLVWLEKQCGNITFEHADLRDDASFIPAEDIPTGIQMLLSKLQDRSVYGIAASEEGYYARLENMLKHIVLYLQENPEEQSAKIARLSISAKGAHCGARWDREIVDLYKEITGQSLSSDPEQWLLYQIDSFKIACPGIITGKNGLGDPHEAALIQRSASEIQLAFPARAGGEQWDPFSGKQNFPNENEARLAFFTEYNPIELIHHMRRVINEALPDTYVERNASPEELSQYKHGIEFANFLFQVLKQRAEENLTQDQRVQVDTINSNCEMRLAACSKRISVLRAREDSEENKMELEKLRITMEQYVEERDNLKGNLLTRVINDLFRELDTEDVFWTLTEKGALEVLIYLRILAP